MRLIIDGLECTAGPGQTILQAAEQNGIAIPHLCYHPALPGQAACRLCVVEVWEGEAAAAPAVAGGGGGRGTGAGALGTTASRTSQAGALGTTASRGNASPSPENPGAIVVSCTYPAQEGQQVVTQSERIRGLRRTILSLLKEEAPLAEGVFIDYCAEYGVAGHGLEYSVNRYGKCILCGLCTKACEELGSCAIQNTMRGIDKLVAPPFNEPPADCIGCAACARVCPTGSIRCTEGRDDQGRAVRKIWGKTFELVRCASCGQPFATREQLDWLGSRLLEADLHHQYCPACRPRASLATPIGWS